MSRLRVGIVRYASLATAIERALGTTPAPECRIGQGRITITFRRLGATHWPESRQIDYALRVAATAREILANDARRSVRQRTSRAIQVVYEDASLVKGCAVVARWECVVPA
ncbi:MAG TPA: hypothetical protein VH539_18415 [Gemmatimonadaceae bacterium]|jgi:uncharacterized protein YdiU (UPF0061 family)